MVPIVVYPSNQVQSPSTWLYIIHVIYNQPQADTICVQGDVPEQKWMENMKSPGTELRF